MHAIAIAKAKEKKGGEVKYLKPRNLLLNIIRQIAESQAVRLLQRTEFPFKDLLVQNLADAHTPPRRLIAVAGPNTLPSSSDLAAAETSLLQAIDDGVQVEADVGAVRNEDALAGSGQALFLEGGQLLEEAGHVEDRAGTD